MNKIKLFAACMMLIVVINYACNVTDNETKERKQLNIDLLQLSKAKRPDSTGYLPAPFFYTLEPAQLQCRIPALQSFIFATYRGLWIFIGGEKKGFHGTGNDPKPFPASVTNDSIWVVDVNGQQSWSVAVPSAWKTTLCATNAAYTQTDSLLFICGGFTRSDSTQSNFNYTSNSFVTINLPSLWSYVKSNGMSMPFSYIITRQAQSPYVQVTGGALLQYGNYFYLIGGQNYNKMYSPGVTGIYTNAIRRFSLQNTGGSWAITDTASYVDSVNLHRRDMNVVAAPGGGVDAVLYGGVFSKDGSAYRRPVYINGLGKGTPSIMLGPDEQVVNQYSCAVATYTDSSTGMLMSTFFGGITYKMYNSDSGRLVIGDDGIPMPFSNMVSTFVSNSAGQSVEFIQHPPYGPLLPGYVGANAVFIPAPQVAMAGRPGVIDLAKINADTTIRGLVGYLFGGIVSKGPTSGTTPKGFVPTYANPVLYNVYLNYRTGN